MSDTEALMWTAEKDPWLSAAMGSVATFDKPIDVEWFRRRIAGAVAVIPRLRERVAPSVAGLAPPRWVTDSEFDLDRHIRVIRLPEPGTTEQLNAFVADLFMTPFDRSAPLWSYTAIEGLEGDRSALVMKLHHSIADGTGTLRLSEEYVDIDANATMPDPVDLTGLLATALEDNPPPQNFKETLTDSLGHFARRQAGMARRAAGEVSLWGADPVRATRAAEELSNVARVLANQTGVSFNDARSATSGSPLWRQRSRHRHYETLDADLGRAKATAKALGGSLNDWFVTGVHVAVQRYHQHHDCEVENFNASFVVSTRNDSAAGGNSFTPVTVALAGTEQDLAQTFAENIERTAALAHSARRSGASAEVLATAAAMLPSSVITRTARARAARQDFATSNLRGSPIPLYIAGQQIQHLRPIGPVAATAFNITALSYGAHLSFGLMVDAVAVTAPQLLRDQIAQAFVDLEVAAGITPVKQTGPAPKKAAAKRTASKKTTREKTTREKATKKPAAERSPAKKPSRTAKKTTAKPRSAKTTS